MENLRKHGKPPFHIALIHGGPGATGQLLPIAQELSSTYGIIEPLQVSSSIAGQIHKLHIILEKYSSKNVILIGHSWGAWLSLLYASWYPSIIKKMIFINSAPFKQQYVSQILNTRLNRLNNIEKREYHKLIESLSNPYEKDKNIPFARLGKLLLKTDTFCPLHNLEETTEYHYTIFHHVWAEAEELRQSGKLLNAGKKIQCPVVAIHGDYDPHPFQGVKEPLSENINDFRFILLYNCGHYPWIERYAKKIFYQILDKELGKVQSS